MPSKSAQPKTPTRQPGTAPDNHEVPNGAEQAASQEREALQQMGTEAQLAINEGGRSNDSSERGNPEGAVHGLPKPALKGTWR